MTVPWQGNWQCSWQAEFRRAGLQVAEKSRVLESRVPVTHTRHHLQRPDKKHKAEYKRDKNQKNIKYYTMAYFWPILYYLCYYTTKSANSTGIRR